MGGMIKAAVADEQHNTVTAGKDRPPINAKSLYKYKFTDSKKRILENGWAREATVEQFPISEGIAGVDMLLEPGGVRELHWHAVAAEWAYMLEGHARITIIDPEGKSEVADFGPAMYGIFPKVMVILFRRLRVAPILFWLLIMGIFQNLALSASLIG